MKFPSIFVLSTTGKKVVVARKKDFKRGYHLPVEEAVAEAPVAKVEEEEDAQAAVAEEAPAELDEKAKFEEMKEARAWLKPELKDEYNRLKAIYG